MGMTIIEKILARASGQKSVAPGDLADVTVDTVALFDSGFSCLKSNTYIVLHVIGR